MHLSARAYHHFGTYMTHNYRQIVYGNSSQSITEEVYGKTSINSQNLNAIQQHLQIQHTSLPTALNYKAQ